MFRSLPACLFEGLLEAAQQAEPKPELSTFAAKRSDQRARPKLSLASWAEITERSKQAQKRRQGCLSSHDICRLTAHCALIETMPLLDGAPDKLSLRSLRSAPCPLRFVRAPPRIRCGRCELPRSRQCDLDQSCSGREGSIALCNATVHQICSEKSL